ncbi:hypothetical protein B0H13DRAFT_2343457 [Mycena leptocephala]|nr:hypothetical protein B0H13DRAFT_2343457 [Mycena leptocephala]
MSYLVAGIILTGMSTTGETIFENLKNFDLTEFSNSPSLCRRSILDDRFRHNWQCQKMPRNYGKKDKLKEQDDKRGLVSFGATRFSTFVEQASSVSRCLPAMEKCYAEGLVEFNTKVTKPLQKYFIRDSPDQLELRAQLYDINMLLKPIARATYSTNLKTLESTQVTCSDLFTIWIRIAIGVQQVFCDLTSLSLYFGKSALSFRKEGGGPRSGPPTACKINKYHKETIDCYNRRFAIFMNDCTPSRFVLAYLLDPIYYRDGAMRFGLPPRVNFGKKTASPFVVNLITNARVMLQNEQKRERRGDEAEADFSEADNMYKHCLTSTWRRSNLNTAYMYRKAQFDLPCKDMSLRLAWGEMLSNDSNTYVLARLAIRLFSAVPSEMCDERTASKLTAMSTAKRSNLGPENLIRCAQLNQYWRYRFGSSEVQQHCQKVRLELPTTNRKPSDPIVAGIPTLQDLLNADSNSDRSITCNTPF